MADPERNAKSFRCRGQASIHVARLGGATGHARDDKRRRETFSEQRDTQIELRFVQLRQRIVQEHHLLKQR